MNSKQILYNDEPVLQVGGWKVLCPNMYGKKYKGLERPLLVHKCAEYSQNPEGDRWNEFYSPGLPQGVPHCGHCDDPVPDEIQGLLAMYYWDATEIPEGMPAASNSCYRNKNS